MVIPALTAGEPLLGGTISPEIPEKALDSKEKSGMLALCFQVLFSHLAGWDPPSLCPRFPHPKGQSEAKQQSPSTRWVWRTGRRRLQLLPSSTPVWVQVT